jgi:hypothetical protein
LGIFQTRYMVKMMIDFAAFLKTTGVNTARSSFIPGTQLNVLLGHAGLECKVWKKVMPNRPCQGALR